MALPTTPITRPEFKYTPAAATDVTQTWRKFGWVPRSAAQAIMASPLHPAQVQYNEYMRLVMGIDGGLGITP